MRQAGVTEAPVRERRPRAWVDFGVDESWEPARPTRTRRERAVDSWVDDADLFAPRYEDDMEPARARGALARQIAEPRRRDVAARSEVQSPRFDAPAVRVEDVALASSAGNATAVIEHDAVAVSVDVIAHPAYLPAPPPVAAPAAEARPPERPAADPRVAPASDDTHAAGTAVAGRRTVTIRGRGAERDLAFPQPGRARRQPVRRHERPGFKPDRAALWALLLCVVLVLVAATSSRAATLSHCRCAAQSAAAHIVHLAPATTPPVVVVSAHH